MQCIAISADKCTGHGLCYGVAPQLLEDDDEGYVTLRGGAKPVPDDQLAAAQSALQFCPEGAITLVDEQESVR